MDQDQLWIRGMFICQVRGPRDLSNFRDCEHEASCGWALGWAPSGTPKLLVNEEVEKVKVIQSSACF